MVRDRDDIGSNRSSNRPLLELHKARMSRRAALKGFVTTAAFGAVGGTLTSKIALAAAGDPSTLTFSSLAQVIKEDQQVAPGYTRRGPDPLGRQVVDEAPALDPMAPDRRPRRPGSSATTSDYHRLLPLPRGSDSSDHGLLARQSRVHQIRS